MAESITGPKFRSRTPGIPFFKDDKYTVRIEIAPKINSRSEFQTQYEILRNKAVDHFIMHYYPELWPGVNNVLGSIPTHAEYQDLYDALRSTVYDATNVTGFYQPLAPPVAGRSFIVATYDPSTSVDAIRRRLRTSTFGGQSASSYFPSFQDSAGNSFLRGMPPMGPVIEYYNSIQEKGGITGGGSQSTFIVGSMMENQDIINNGLLAFAMQLAAYPGGMNSNLDMTFLQMDVQQFLNLFIRTLVNQFSTQAEVREFDEADTLTIFFGGYADDPNSVAISGMEYLVVDESPAPQTMAVGYLTNMSYNSSFKDPLTLAMLRNYEDTLEGMMQMQGPYAGQPMMMDGEQFSFATFAQGLGPGALGDTPENWEELDFITPIVNQTAEEVEGYAKAAIEAGLPVDTKSLSDGIEVALTSKEIRELRDKVLNNPELAQKVFAEQQAKTLKAGIDVSKKLGRILENGPMGFMKKNSPLDMVFRQFGIQEVAKEAFRCLTFGLAPELGRINNAVQKALTNQAGSIYLPPPEQPAASISKPDIDLEMFKPFSFTGDIWKQILKSIIDGLRNAVLEIMKELANVLRELCDFNNPFAEDFGAQDITDFLPSEPNIYGANDGSSALQGMADRMGVPRATIYQYLRDLSSILSSMEICYLFTDPSQVTDELLKRIVVYNSTYDDEYVKTVLTNRNNIMAFFANLATIVDVTQLCDEIANALYELNQDDICLTESDLANALERQNIDSLLDLMENGLQLELPPVNFECPDKAGFIDNPLFSRAVPETLNMTTELVELQFMNSTQAALNVLLEPSVTAGPSLGLATMAALSASTQGASDPVSETTQGAANLALLDTIATKFQTFSEVLEDALDSEACSEALAPNVLVQLQKAVPALQEVFNSGEFLEAIQNIGDTFTNLSASVFAASGSGQTPRVTYAFPANYTSNFSNFLPATGPTWENGQVDSGDLDDDGNIIYVPAVGQTRVSAGGFSAHTADSTAPNLTVFDTSGDQNVNIALDSAYYDSYEDLDLRFTFNTLGQTDSLSLTYPRFDSAAPSTMSGTEVSFAYVTLSSSQTTAYLPDRAQFRITSSILDIMESHFVPRNDDVSNFVGVVPQDQVRLQTNPYVNRFTSPVMSNLNPLLTYMNGGQSLVVREEVETQLFPSLFAGLTQAMFSYIRKNGIFDAPTVRGLQLFKDNTNCPPDLAADLLDANGILDQVKAEFLESACFDEMPLDIKIRYATMLSLFYSLIQVELAELIIKNIFVFSAFNVDELMEKPVIAQFIATQVRNDVITKLQRRPRVRQAIIEYYNFKMARPSTASQGGLLDHNDQVVFPIGTTFSTTNWDALVEYLVSQRVHWSKTAVANVLRMARADSSFRKSFDEVFIEDVLGFGRRLSSNPADPSSDFAAELAGRTKGSPLPYGTMLIERVVSWTGLTGGAAPDALEATRETGGELELSEFRNSFFFGGASPFIEGSDPLPSSQTSWEFEFTGLVVKYRLVYYLPTQGVSTAESYELGTLDMENYTTKLTGRVWRTDADYAPSSSPGAGFPAYIRDILTDSTATTFQYPDGSPADADVQYAVTPDNQEFIRVKIADFDDLLTAPGLQGAFGQENWETLRDELFHPKYIEDAIQTTASRLSRKEEVARIARDPMYKKIFSETFNQEFITMVPVYQNFYLTSRYFGKIETVFDSTKNFIIQAFIDVVTGKDPRPPVGNERPNAAAAVRNSAGPDFAAQFEGLGRDFILKMLIETPIMILKGLAEMIDPHVAIWKVVRNVTGMAFDELAKAMDASGALQAVDDAIAEAGFTPFGMRGDDLIALMLCLLDYGMTAAIMNDPGTQNVPEEVINNILPRMSTEGIDFTGTFSGMLMLPPLPFGILYILLDLLKKHLAEELTSDDSALSGEESLAEC
jgi:AcrR family transcriptional regulator